MSVTLSELLKSDKPVLIDFYATWCGPCKTMSPILDAVKKMVGETVTVVKIDVDKNPLASTEYEVRGVPTLILFKDGKPVWRQSGVVQKDGIVNIIKQFA